MGRIGGRDVRSREPVRNAGRTRTERRPLRDSRILTGMIRAPPGVPEPGAPVTVMGVLDAGRQWVEERLESIAALRIGGGGAGRLDALDRAHAGRPVRRRGDAVRRTKAAATPRSRPPRPRSTGSGCGWPGASGSAAGARAGSAPGPRPGARSSRGRTEARLLPGTRRRNGGFRPGPRRRRCAAGSGRRRRRRARRARAPSSTRGSRGRRGAGAARRAGIPAARRGAGRSRCWRKGV